VITSMSRSSCLRGVPSKNRFQNSLALNPGSSLPRSFGSLQGSRTVPITEVKISGFRDEASFGRLNALSDRDHVDNFGDSFAQIPRNSVAKGHFTGRTADAGPEESNLNHTRFGDIDEFEIASILLNPRTNQAQNSFHPRLEWLIRSIWGGI
jgi:hypothetical protein